MEDGTTFEGSGFGYPREVTGEVVFNTGMVGYPEALTDPSYSGQILTQTYPLIGNYGVPPFSLTDEFGMPLHFESNRIQVKGYIIHRLSKSCSHWSSKKSLQEWMFEQKTPGVEGIDTRLLTRKLRVRGVMLGILKVYDDNERVDLDEYRIRRVATEFGIPIFTNFEVFEAFVNAVSRNYDFSIKSLNEFQEGLLWI